MTQACRSIFDGAPFGAAAVVDRAHVREGMEVVASSAFVGHVRTLAEFHLAID
jgi:hypothetical protein